MAPSRAQPGLIPLAAATSLLPPAILVGWHLLRPGHDAADLPVLALALALAGFGVGLILHGRARAATAQVRDELASAPESRGADSRPIASGEASSREFSGAPDTGEEALSTSAMRRGTEVQALLDTLTIGVCLIDRRGRITVSNRRFAAILGCVEATAAPGESIGELLAQSVRPDDPENGYDDRLESLGLIQALRGRPSEREWQRGDGTVIESAWTPVADVGAALVVSDLTRRRQTETALREAKEIAEATTRTKSEFLANMSHELRTPLNAIMGFSEIMKNELFGEIGNANYRDYASDIYDSGRHLLTLINDILDMSKAEAGKIELQEDTVSVEAMIEACLRLVKARAETGRLTLEVARSEVPIRLWADERRMKQVLLNLLSNAVKFTPAGGKVTIAAGVERSGSFILSVRDTGIGIAPEDIPKALAPFGQVDSKLARRFDGTGLGLPLSRVLVELHGGRLDLHSRVAAGTTVRVRLPSDRILAPESTEAPIAVSA